MYRELKTEQLEVLYKRYQESEKRLENRGAVVTWNPRSYDDMFLTTTNRIRHLIEVELRKRANV